MAERRRCPICLEAFEPSRADQRTCSPACRQRAYRLRRRRWRVEPDGRVLVDGEQVGWVPAPGVVWDATGVEWVHRPPVRGFRASRAAPQRSARPSVLVLRSAAWLVEAWEERVDGRDADELQAAARELRRRADEAALAPRDAERALGDEAEQRLLYAVLERLPRA